jgi:transcription-repair coupling factor (superfamily II helicase)
VALVVGGGAVGAETVVEEAAFFAGMGRENTGKGLRVEALPPGGAAGEGAEFEAMCDLLRVLAAVHCSRDARALLVACSVEGLGRWCPGRETWAVEGGVSEEGGVCVVRRGDVLELGAFVERLGRGLGYDGEMVCEAPGQFAVRGGLVDVYPLNAGMPVRIDFFGNEVESIRVFDPTSQRSEGEVEEVVICAPAREPLVGTNTQTATGCAGAFTEHLPEGVLWIVCEPFPEGDGARLPLRKGDTLLVVTALDEAPQWARTLAPGLEVRPFEVRVLEALAGAGLGADRLAMEGEAREHLLCQLAQWQAAGAHITLVGETPGSLERLQTILAETRRRHAAAKDFSPTLHQGLLAEGFAIFDAPGTPAAVFATERELFGRLRRHIPTLRHRRLPHKSRVEQLLDFNELADADPLVHVQHGICLYRGITTLEHRGRTEEMITLQFANNITTHLPLREAHLLSRYVGLRKTPPKLGKIGSGAWEKTRRAAEAATVDFAAELLALHARRHTRPGIPHPPDAALPWLGEFERAFPHQETPDQARAIEETKRDMELPSPMDRLICGDVGYGKTEVALRAAFKAVLGGTQVALLAPTTVLAQQHCNTFRERLAPYPLSVEMLSRFRTPAQRARIIAQINTARVDIVIGTHALLSPAIRFPKLGLLIIDEEHRFGVRQKELIKRLRENVDVLSMSATPIPRTLYLALMGARDLSVIETPPRERLPIRTHVRAYDPRLVCEAIRHEVNRGGQVFYLHNRVETIATVADRLGKMLPGIRFGIGHGKMDERALEHIMTAFVAGQYDVLVCTTIIETGLDIPNCNTLIIEGADRFGLSQLYQLRGRVGRFNRQAHAYLLLHKHTRLLDPAYRRLSAIRQHNQLGAGFRIAMRDLELRGTGNLLGREQSGHIASIGFDLYCQLLRQSISRLKGQPNTPTHRAELHLDFIQYDPNPLPLPENTPADKDSDPGHCPILTATLPPSYIADTRLRIEFYRRLATAPTLDDVRKTAADMQDRFGKIPPPAAAFIELAELRRLAETAGILSVETQGARLKCKRLHPDANGNAYLKTGVNFPRLTQSNPLKRLREIKTFLARNTPHPPLNARSITPAGAASPVHNSNAKAPCHPSMDSPEATRAPAARASRKNAVAPPP